MRSYCGVWPIRCCQGSKTNKSNCRFEKIDIILACRQSQSGFIWPETIVIILQYLLILAWVGLKGGEVWSYLRSIAWQFASLDAFYHPSKPLTVFIISCPDKHELIFHITT